MQYFHLPTVARSCSIPKLSPLQVIVVTSFAIIPRVRPFLITPQQISVGTQLLDPRRLTKSYKTSILQRSIPEYCLTSTSNQNLFHSSCRTTLLNNVFTKTSQRPVMNAVAKIHEVAASDIITEQSCAVGDADSGWGSSVGLDEDALLPEHPGLVAGALPNGLRYSILQNKIPANRIYANLEVHAGSVDEEDNEQVAQLHTL